MISKAVQLLRSGRLVAFATETVYGLGADATNSLAIRKVFTVKGRPATNPLIVHVADAKIARRYTRGWPDRADQLARAFWPGPLTLVLEKSDVIVPEVTAGRASVGIRVPNHPMALELLTAFDGPVAAPSANRANHISPTSAADVAAELGDAVDLILDGGRCTVGIESTVIDLTGAAPCILRPGGIRRDQIETVIGPVDVFQGSVVTGTSAASPGQQRRHYSPSTPAFRFDRSDRDAMLHRVQNGEQIILLLLGNLNPPEALSTLIEMPDEPEAYARRLYQTLREQDARRLAAIFIEMPPDEPPWVAVRDRLMRATQVFNRHE